LRIAGQKGWHGVAIASRRPITDAPQLDICRNKHARVVSAVVEGVEIQNFYIPAGGDLPDRELNEKFDHKMDYYERLTAEMAAYGTSSKPLLLAGDFNIAPNEFDVWNHRYMSKVVSHTPGEVETLYRLQNAAASTTWSATPSLSRRSWPAGGATAPRTSASPTAACASTTCGPRPA
jgi:exodeoxyribonuclease-3